MGKKKSRFLKIFFSSFFTNCFNTYNWLSKVNCSDRYIFDGLQVMLKNMNFVFFSYNLLTHSDNLLLKVCSTWVGREEPACVGRLAVLTGYKWRTGQIVTLL